MLFLPDLVLFYRKYLCLVYGKNQKYRILVGIYPLCFLSFLALTCVNSLLKFLCKPLLDITISFPYLATMDYFYPLLQSATPRSPITP